MDLFSNNAKVVLGIAVADTDTELYPGSETDVSSLVQSLSADEFQRLTIEHPGHPEIPPEIVRAIQLEPVYPMIKIVRGQEGTTAQSWPAGAVMTGRVTAGMLAALAQSDTSDGTVARETIDDRYSSYWVVSGMTHMRYSALRGAPEPENNATDPKQIAYALCALEVVRQSGIHDFGVPPLHSAATTYMPGDVVRPATPDGYQYTLYQPKGVTLGVSGAVTFGANTSMYDGASNTIGVWPRVAHPVDVTQDIVAPGGPVGAGMIVAECGVVILLTSATTAPAFDIGVPGDTTAFASAQAATFTAVTGGSIGLLRAPAISHQKLVRQLTFKVTTSADAPCRGYFYCRGVLVNPG